MSASFIDLNGPERDQFVVDVNNARNLNLENVFTVPKRLQLSFKNFVDLVDGAVLGDRHRFTDVLPLAQKWHVASLLWHPLTAKWEWVLLAGAFYATVFWVARNLKRSALGRMLVAISEDEIFCQSLGKNVGLAKLQSFVLGAMLAAVPGALYAHYVSFIDPTSFTIHESIFILAIIIIGGMGNLWGSLAAAAFMILVPEALRFVGLPGGIAANVRQMLYGAALILVIWLQHAKTKQRTLFANASS